MQSREREGVAKVHPATRAVEPDDPLNLCGYEVPGDPDLMLRVLVEEFARIGSGLPQLMQLCRDPFYQGLHGLWLQLGDEETQRRISAILSRCGVIRTTTQSETEPESLVQLTLLHHGQGEDQDACRP